MKVNHVHIASKTTRDMWKRREKALGTFHWLRFLSIRMIRAFGSDFRRIGSEE